MPIRSRTRYPGDIDPALGQTTSLSYLPPWVAGRYYETCIVVAANTTTLSFTVGTLISTPFFVPNAITATSIGVEVTAAAATGNTARLAIYQSDNSTGWPTTLLIDAGNIAVDATGFIAATISQILIPGMYWASICTTAPALTLRAISATSFHGLSLADGTSSISNGAGNEIANLGIGRFIASTTYPYYFPIIGANATNAASTAGASAPRVLIGV